MADDSPDGPATLAHRRDLLERALHLVDRLPAVQREAIRMYVEGFALHGRWLEQDTTSPTPLSAGAPDGFTAPEVTASPARWLHAIAALVRQGRLAEADDELAAFQRRYPDYRRPAAP
jgi:hypothetical protein